ncbi:hypothetical protein P691DRAFT_188657 [Macrolepiota fuliginosa MF-IS2]|uniref:Uncharacterized protein n=1 Tax=Macrolepiota fuliginosa MF-IS2 TaxID=1400762 RepID=A0A9P5XB33_9AGAR|nr:hypothetical protein P691DRAFT_188657 [Macrolepiota fuliginosa MF-IS2]
MTPGSLAPLVENEGSGSYPHSPGSRLMPGENTDNTRINGDLGVDARPGLTVNITGTDSSVFYTCTRAPPPPGFPVPVSTTIPMPHAPLFNSRSDARTLGGAGVAPVRSVGFGGTMVVRRKAVGLGSPLANCVATFESLLHLRSGEDVCDGDGNNDGSSVLDASESEAETQEEEDVDADEETMSPVLMRAKDSLLLKDVRKRKTRLFPK